MGIKGEAKEPMKTKRKRQNWDEGKKKTSDDEVLTQYAIDHAILVTPAESITPHLLMMCSLPLPSPRNPPYP